MGCGLVGPKELWKVQHDPFLAVPAEIAQLRQAPGRSAWTCRGLRPKWAPNLPLAAHHDEPLSTSLPPPGTPSRGPGHAIQGPRRGAPTTRWARQATN